MVDLTFILSFPATHERVISIYRWPMADGRWHGMSPVTDILSYFYVSTFTFKSNQRYKPSESRLSMFVSVSLPCIWTDKAMRRVQVSPTFAILLLERISGR
ncbi:hypothetical protein MPSEU_001012100 [Mayamaea pseudoterrestris]|nr:hypothetical protein MPSEU_001012100 [Mayamaea pseudoterrestris]